MSGLPPSPPSTGIRAPHRVGGDEEQLHLLGLFQQAPGFVCFFRGPSLVCELANHSYYQLVGHREMVGKAVRDALPEVEGQGFFELLDTVYRTGTPFVGRGMRASLQRVPNAPLTEVFVDLVYQPIVGPDGAVVGILVQGHDVTEAKRQESQREAAEHALRASEERYRAIFDAIDDGFCLLQMIVDDDGNVVDYAFLEANAAFETHTGLKNPVGRTARELIPDLDRSWLQLYGRVADNGETKRFESYAPALGRWFDVFASRVGPPEVRQVALVFKDISERKRAAEEREGLLAREREARHQAERASAVKDEFLATVSHELRTPLNSMLGWTHLLRSGTLTPEKRDRALEVVERNARAQARVIDNLLDVSRILAGKLRLDVQPVELNAVVEAALETVRPAADAKGVRLQATLAEAATVMGDAHRLQQVVWNLLANAVKFTLNGGRVQVMTAVHDGLVEITVTDSGQGIAPELLPRIFDRFQQAEGGTTRAHGGLGLGLSIVRQLIEMHGGTVVATSPGPGLGATFLVRLPVSAERPREATTPSSLSSSSSLEMPCPPELAGIHVLVVDDEEDAREMVRALLERCAVRVTLASSAAEALQLIRSQRPDVLVSDIAMPGKDGYDLIREIRRMPAESGGFVPAVALTAYARAQNRTRALLSGFSSHVPKPVEPLELLAVLASLARVPR